MATAPGLTSCCLWPTHAQQITLEGHKRSQSPDPFLLPVGKVRVLHMLPAHLQKHTRGVAFPAFCQSRGQRLRASVLSAQHTASSALSFSSTRGRSCGVQLAAEEDMETQLLSLLAALPIRARLTQAERLCPSAACRSSSVSRAFAPPLLRALLTASWHPNNLAPLPYSGIQHYSGMCCL